MGTVKDSKVKFYISKTAAQATALKDTEPGSIFFTDTGIVVNGQYYGQPNPDASELVTLLGDTAVNRATADADGNNIATTYAKKDDVSGLSGAMHLKGVADTTGDTTFSDGLTTNPVTVGGTSFTANEGDVVIQKDLEYVWTGAKWVKLGDDSSYVLKDGSKVLSTNDFTDALKTKLDGIATGATKVTVDSSLSSTSTNPVQNKVINSALSGKQATLTDTDSGYGQRVKALEDKTTSITNAENYFEINKNDTSLIVDGSNETLRFEDQNEDTILSVKTTGLLHISDSGANKSIDLNCAVPEIKISSTESNVVLNSGSSPYLEMGNGYTGTNVKITTGASAGISTTASDDNPTSFDISAETVTINGTDVLGCLTWQ